MLRTRVITALLLLGLFVPIFVWANNVLFAWVLLIPLMLAAWEWARLNPGPTLMRIPHFAVLYAGLFLVLCLALDGPAWLSLVFGQYVWLGLLLMWLAVAILILSGGLRAWQWVPVWLRLVLGWFILGGAWLAVVEMRAVSLSYVLSVLCSVWVADISAYFGGRAWGGRWITRKLAPQISPNKTWEGAMVAFVATLAFSILTWQLSLIGDSPPPFFAVLLARGGWLLALPCLLLFVVLAIVGDLQESMMKRLAGVKDSSQLLPGHGGVLDRFDALLPVLPLAMLFV